MPELPRAELTPLASTWICPNPQCNRQNIYNPSTELVSDYVTRCYVCREPVNLGMIRDGDLTPIIDPSYIETLVDIAVTCGSLWVRDKIEIEDSRSVPSMCKYLADVFTLEHQNTNWDDADPGYMELIDKFAEERLKEAFPLS